MTILAKNPQSLSYKSNEEAKRPFLKVSILTKMEACVAVVSVSFRPSGASMSCFFSLARYTMQRKLKRLLRRLKKRGLLLFDPERFQ